MLPSRFSRAVNRDLNILLAAPETDKAARATAKSEAERLIAHLRDHPDAFAALARRHSACISGRQGGNLGDITPGTTVREFEAALETMEEGELRREPVATRFGFHVVAVVRVQQGKPLPFDLVRQRIGGWLEAASWSRAVSQYVSILAGKAEIRGIDLKCADSPLVQ